MGVKTALLLVVIGVVVAATAFVGYNMVYAPQQSQVRLIQGKITQEQANQTMQAEVATLLRQVEEHRKRLPPERDASWLLDQVLPIAERNGLRLNTITRQPPSPVGDLTRLSISLDGSASYHQLGAFVDELERAESYLHVERLQMSPPDATGKSAVQLLISTAFVPPIVNQPR